MTEEEKSLLFKDLCTRLPYGVKVYGNYRYSNGDEIVDDIKIKVLDLSSLDWFSNGIEIKPYLRPISSMTEKETVELYEAGFCDNEGTPYDIPGYIDYLNSHHFDYRGLIEKGLAIAAVGENNPYKEKGCNK